MQDCIVPIEGVRKAKDDKSKGFRAERGEGYQVRVMGPSQMWLCVEAQRIHFD